MTAADVHILVRHVGERTLDLCVDRLRAQTDASLELVSATPFAETVRLCFEAGLKAGRRWTLCVDADVVPTPDCVAHMTAMANQAAPDLFEAQGLIADKIFGVRRPAGNHIYRTALLEKALDFAAKSARSLRPESDILWQMIQAGHRWWQDDKVVGCHDHGQFYADLARKVMVQYHKFPDRRQEMQDRFLALSGADTDFAVCYQACGAAQQLLEAPQVDAGALKSAARALVGQLGLVEKTAPDEDEMQKLISVAGAFDGVPLTASDSGYIGPIGYYGQA